ncbi:bacterial proteasome activator family protein [Brevibacterium casei]|uniref:bacterial proteasome activator family protein n=1 Tax=Brevibacterium casei TaxID=33889 RepID=UPI00223B8324|nr:bacterial proteasome activator family protein [Brevibacterium casei]MCT1764590.1 bacterial proteasome activator family protein [Brevibacterium casei]
MTERPTSAENDRPAEAVPPTESPAEAVQPFPSPADPAGPDDGQSTTATRPAADAPATADKAGEPTPVDPTTAQPASADAVQPPSPQPPAPDSAEAADRAGADEDDEEPDISSPAKVMRIGTMVKQLLEEVRGTELDEKGRERLAQIHRQAIDDLEDGISAELVAELDRFARPFDSTDGPPSASELRVAQAQLVGWLEGLFHGIQTAIMAQQAMAQQDGGGRGRIPGIVPPGAGGPGTAAGPESEEDRRRTGNYL